MQYIPDCLLFNHLSPFLDCSLPYRGRHTSGPGVTEAEGGFRGVEQLQARLLPHISEGSQPLRDNSRELQKGLPPPSEIKAKMATAHSAIKVFHVNISCGPPLKGNILGRNAGEMEFSLANLTTLQSHHSYLVQSDSSLKQFINNLLVLIPVISPQSSLPSASTILDTWDQPFLCEITFPFSFIKPCSPGFSLLVSDGVWLVVLFPSLHTDIHHHSLLFPTSSPTFSFTLSFL